MSLLTTRCLAVTVFFCESVSGNCSFFDRQQRDIRRSSDCQRAQAFHAIDDLCGGNVVRVRTSSNDIPRCIIFDMVVGRSNTGPFTLRL